MYIWIMLIITIFLFYLCSKNIEKFWVYGAGTRVCNNRDCDINNRNNISTTIYN